MSKGKKESKAAQGKTILKKGDPVMVIAGGNKEKRPVKGQVGKILRFVGSDRQRAIVEGLNLITVHQKAKGPGQTSGKIKREAPIHVSRLMYFVETIKRPVRLSINLLADGSKVRGYKEKSNKKFVQLAE